MLNKFFTNLLIFGLALNCVIFLFGVFNFGPPNMNMSFMDLTTWNGWFDFSPWNLMFTGAAIAGMTLAAILLRQNTYAIYALLLAALGMIVRPIYEFMTAIPNAIGAWLPDSTNPLYVPDINGVYPNPVPPNPILVVILLLFGFAAFWFVFGLVVQRDIP